MLANTHNNHTYFYMLNRIVPVGLSLIRTLFLAAWHRLILLQRGLYIITPPLAGSQASLSYLLILIAN